MVSIWRMARVMRRLCPSLSGLSSLFRLVLGLDPSGRAPTLQDAVHVIEHEETSAFHIIAFIQKAVVIGEPVPDVRDEGKPCRSFWRSRVEAAAPESMVRHRFELVARDARSEDADSALDSLAPVHAGSDRDR